MDWTERDGKWFAKHNGAELKQVPMRRGHWAGLINGEMAVEGGGLWENRSRLERIAAAPQSETGE